MQDTPTIPPSPTTLKEFHRLFPDEAACIEHFYHLRWPGGFVCPKCGGPAAGVVKTEGLVRCGKGHHISVTSGTALHRTRQPLWDWYWACWLVSTSTPGISALQLQKQLGSKRIEPVFMLLHKIRNALVDPERSPLKGEVEVNEGFIGGPEAGHPGRGAVKKALVVIAVEVRRWTETKETPEGVVHVDRQRAGRARMRVIPNAAAETLLPWIRQNVEKGSLIVTDGLSSYSRLGREGYTHRVMLPEKGQPDNYLPMAHLVISNLKAWLLGTYHGSVDRRHLQAYLNEYVFRFNRRMWRGPAFLRCLRMLIHADPLEYEELYEDGYKHPNPLIDA